jgi:uncharacterized protein YidB (DUF937 family)
MGLLDGILGNVLGSAAGASPSLQTSNPLGEILHSLGGGNVTQGGNLLSAVMSMVQQNGGLPSTLEMFRQKGLGQQADSWVGTGANSSITPDQLQHVFGGDQLQNLAAQLGTSHGQASSILSQILPELVNQLTPNGQVPGNHADLLSQGMSALRRTAG